MTNKTLVVFTFRTRDELEQEGGSQAWKLNPDSARRCTYIVCTRNRHHENAGPEDHQTGFLVGRISRIEVSPERADRYIVRFSEFAEIDVPKVWPGGRNPIMYVDDITSLGIDLGSLRWEPVKDAPEVDYDAEGVDDGLSFEEAKAAIGRRYGFLASQVEITIRG
ncbi:MAG: hypothetical protein JWR73_969 [Tardiphaga sp.]|nr:hypothetical protein [Tardiphaga sp.]